MSSKTLYDGFDTLPGGMDSATPSEYPTMVGRSAYAVNCSHRGGYPHQRPGLKQHDLDVEDKDFYDHFMNNVFQGATTYYPDSGNPVLVVSIGGRVFTIDPFDDFQTNEISIAGDYDISFVTKVWFCQAEKWLIKNDGIDPPLIWDGASSRRPLADEIRAGKAAVYAWGRIWYARPNGRAYRATDMVYSNGNRSDVLKETENTFLTSGDFVIPATAGRITAMAVPGQIDNALGQGPVHIFTDKAVFSNHAPVDRDEWQLMTYPIQTISMNNNGALGQDSTAVVNGDIFYRSVDGIRSYVVARREFSGWGNTPISREVDRFIVNDNKALLDNGSAVLWNNWMLMTCIPSVREGRGITHAGIVVLDFDPLGTMKAKEPPAWEGLWTGLDVHQLVIMNTSTVQRCFVFARGRNDDLQLWEFDMTRWFDGDPGNEVQIQWLFAPRQLDFGARWTLKRLRGGEIFVDQVKGEVDFDVDYKPDDYPCPVDWATFSECSQVETCEDEADPETGCLELLNRQPQYRTRMQLPMPDDACNEIVGRPYRQAYKFQPIVRVAGAARVKGMRLISETMDDPKEIKCGDAACKTLECCDIDPIEHRADGGVYPYPAY